MSLFLTKLVSLLFSYGFFASLKLKRSTLDNIEIYISFVLPFKF